MTTATPSRKMYSHLPVPQKMLWLAAAFVLSPLNALASECLHITLFLHAFQAVIQRFLHLRTS